MSDFINNLTDKLTYAYEPKLFFLDAFPTTEITDANTVSTLATYSSNKLKNADHIKVGYRIFIDNQSDANEAFDITLNFGDSSITETVTVTTEESATVAISSELVRIDPSRFLVHTEFIFKEADNTVTYFFDTSISDLVEVTGVTITAENTSAINTGCDLQGSGGYVLVDTF